MARYRPVDSAQSFPALEEEVLARWRERDVFAESVRRREGSPPFVFYEGPPTANGRPGSHHVLARVFKDVFPRYKTMQGHYVQRKGGWDCHGLPVELEIEKELGFKSKDDIERYGVAEFNAKCRESVLRYIDEWNRLTERIGFWIDTDDAYFTLDNSYVESVWWSLKQVFDKGLLTEGHKVVPYCTRCGTALSSHEVAVGYKDTVDPSVFVKFPLRDEPGVSLLAWTTMPWTLVPHAAMAVDPDVTYVRARLGEERLILAEALVERVLGEEAEVEERLPGAKLLGLRYEPPFPYLSDYGPNGHTVLAGDFVSTEDGTGVVHTGAAFGEDDFRAGHRERGHGPQPGPARRHVRRAHRTVRRAARARGRRTDRRGAARVRAPVSRRRVHPLLSALLALRHAADLLRQDGLVRAHQRGQGSAAGRQRDDRLAPGPHQARAVRQVAGEQRGLGAVARALLGHPASDLALRGRPRARDLRRLAGGDPRPRRHAARRRAPALHRRGGAELRRLRRRDAARARPDRRLVGLGLHALRPVARPVREPGRLRARLPRRLHLRGARPDARLVLLAAGACRCCCSAAPRSRPASAWG